MTIVWLVLLLVIAWTSDFEKGSKDLFSVWLAAQAVADGRFDQVYPSLGATFTMQAPDGWVAAAAASGQAGVLYPYIYPPLWAWLLAPATSHLSFGQFVLVVSALNPLLMVLMLIVAHRWAAPRLAQPLFVGLGLLLLLGSSVGSIAIFQNQPQILVSCLCVLAIERAENDAPLSAGVLLGLAAALKVYPVLYALVWLVQGGRSRALSAFALAGGSLGIASVVVAGWPMHAWFLGLLDQIARSSILTDVTYTISGIFAQLALLDRIVWVTNTTGDADLAGYGWWTVQLPAWLAAGLKLAMAGVAVAGGLLLRRAGPTARPAIWPAVVIVLALVGPLSWSYHYMAALAFLPMLADRLPVRVAVPIFAAFVLMTFPPLITTMRPWFGMLLFTQLAGVLALALAAAVLVAVQGRSPPAPDARQGPTPPRPPLHPPAPSL